ncbi:MAG: hypothetical protein H0T64_04405 [Pyrinomonadaceae bacterium]|nr:hypothetical protein [Pyrinomonadaceae bacterium]
MRVFTAPERSEEGREQILVAVGDEVLLAKLDRYKEITARLADPRRINEVEAQKLIGEGKAFYWASGSIHSPETGSPEMLMELAYRPAVEESPVPFLYTSTGAGPYNAWLDPITVDEWNLLAYHEVGELTKRGVPGVWTHGFYDGWAPNYMFRHRTLGFNRGTVGPHN